MTEHVNAVETLKRFLRLAAADEGGVWDEVELVCCELLEEIAADNPRALLHFVFVAGQFASYAVGLVAEAHGTDAAGALKLVEDGILADLSSGPAE
jgi:hypothetical protein